ncbi:transposase [Streptomyces albidochromogenes]|uniref:Transposase n=1 Tax=Streptomyces albidochromogenes TaxID=329524 RepID=A0ABW6FD80_9ACTN
MLTYDSAILFVATSGCTWRQLPAASFGPSEATPHRRFAEWTADQIRRGNCGIDRGTGIGWIRSRAWME